MDKPGATSLACHIVVLWIDSALDEGALDEWCEGLSDDEGDAERLRVAMGELRDRMLMRSAKTLEKIASKKVKPSTAG